jgi:carbon starvation protein CstA
VDPVDPPVEPPEPYVPEVVEPIQPVVDEPVAPPVVNEVKIDPTPVAEESPHQATINQLADAGVPILTIGGQEVPLVAFPGMSAWALLNLILAILGIIFTVVTVFRMQVQKRREEDDFDYREEGEEKQSFRKHAWIIPAIALAVFGIIFFIRTEDMNALMVLLWDQWTIFNALAFVGVIIATKKALKEKDDEEEPYETDFNVDTYFRPGKETV